MTWPNGLERPAAALAPPHRRSTRPLPATIRPGQPDSPLRDARPDSAFRTSHVAAWCIAGTAGWAALITGVWLVMGAFGHVLP